MTITIPLESQGKILSILTNKTSANNLILRLFTNNITPDLNTVLGDITEASGSGYASIELLGANWTINSSTSPSIATYPEQIFTFNAALGLVYGYYLTKKTTNELISIEQFIVDGIPANFDIQNSAHSIVITPKIYLRNLTI